MGALSRIGLDCLVQQHALDTLVETGTGHGHNLITALQWHEFKDLRSIEIDPQTYHRNVVTFANEPRVKIYFGDSALVLGKLAVVLAPERRVLWWLDAHFPGSGRIEPVPMVVGGDRVALVPLAIELRELLKVRNLTHDVLVVDDLGLFEPGAYDHDPAELRTALGFAPLTWLDERLKRTHRIERLTRDGGYLIARPLA